MYYIGTGTQYIATKANNHMYVTENLDEARRYSTPQRASNALVTLPRKFYEISSKWSVREDIVPKEEVVEEQFNNENDSTDEIPDVDFLELLSQLASLKSVKNGCLTRMRGELSRINEEITNLEHYIEFSKFNVADGYTAYKMMRDTLQERRRIKDTINIATEIFNDCDVDKISDLKNQLDNRSYKPRQLTSLF